MWVARNRVLTDNLNERESDSGRDWVDDIATCLSLANKNRAAARTNPENFVFFIVHMYHMLGERADGQPWSIDKRWDFELVGTGKNRVFGAITTAQQ
jgi:hypothetical protein